MINFALIGAAGFVAPRHLQAIKKTGNNLIAAVDKSDSVGVLDSYFPDAKFFVEFERFDRFVDKLRREEPLKAIEFVSICSPNYLHDSHIRFALRSNANAICEKPLVLSPWNLDALSKIELEYEKNISSILQLRLHPNVIELKKQLKGQSNSQRHKVVLTYVTPRGGWYDVSWKGDAEKSGGVISNIGIHFFDLLIWLFGSVRKSALNNFENKKASGFIELERADVQWFLSIDRFDLANHDENGNSAFRSLSIDGNDLDLSHGFTDLHTASYERVLDGQGFGVEESRSAIEFVHSLRNSDVESALVEPHQYLIRQ